MTAIQDQVPHHHCYGCGADNDKGMQIKSHWHGDVCICTYTPKPEQCAGPKHYVYGGTIASLIDCHSVNTALSNYYLQEGRGIGEAPEIWCVTGRLAVDYLAPTPIDHEIELRTRIVECTEKKTRLETRVYSGETHVANGEVIAIRVPPSWRGSA